MHSDIRKIFEKQQRFRESSIRSWLSPAQLEFVESQNGATLKEKFLRAAGEGKCKCCGKESGYVEKTRFYAYCSDACEKASHGVRKTAGVQEHLDKWELTCTNLEGYTDNQYRLAVTCKNGHQSDVEAFYLFYGYGGCKQCEKADRPVKEKKARPKKEKAPSIMEPYVPRKRVLIKTSNLLDSDTAYMVDNGYPILECLGPNKHGSRQYKLMTPCGHEWTSTFQNARKLIDRSRAQDTPSACGVCGPTNRMQIALAGYIRKYGITEEEMVQFEIYSKVVRGLTQKNYNENKFQINPHNLPRGIRDYHLDHIKPIAQCFREGLTPNEAAAPSNLQMLYYKDNLSKGSKYYA